MQQRQETRTGRRLQNALYVAWVGEANGSASKACLAAESSPRWGRVRGAASTCVSTVLSKLVVVLQWLQVSFVEEQRRLQHGFLPPA